MGFPVGYSELFIPKLLLPLLTLLGFIRKFCYSLLSILELQHAHEHEHETTSFFKNEYSGAAAAELIRELLPVARFSDLAEIDATGDNCVVCLYEFRCDDEIRRLRSCRHVFHRSCVDRWIDSGRDTCPLCRTDFVPADMKEAFSERLLVRYNGFIN